MLCTINHYFRFYDRSFLNIYICCLFYHWWRGQLSTDYLLYIYISFQGTTLLLQILILNYKFLTLTLLRKARGQLKGEAGRMKTSCRQRYCSPLSSIDLPWPWHSLYRQPWLISFPVPALRSACPLFSHSG